MIGVNRGIFGVPSQKKTEIEDLLKALEALNPSPRPTENLDTVKDLFMSESLARFVVALIVASCNCNSQKIFWEKISTKLI